MKGTGSPVPKTDQDMAQQSHVTGATSDRAIISHDAATSAGAQVWGLQALANVSEGRTRSSGGF